jgi:hypothetical protein
MGKLVMTTAKTERFSFLGRFSAVCTASSFFVSRFVENMKLTLTKKLLWL